jgi:uncharacterized protein (DUF58 family)
MGGTSGFLLRYLLFLLCLTAAAVNTGNNLLYLVLSLMAAFGVLAFAAAGRSLSRLDASLVLPDEVAAGQSFVVGIEARSTEGWLPTGWSEASLTEFPGEAPAASVPTLPPGGRAVVSLRARADRRGIYSGIGLRTATAWPFGLFRRTRPAAGAAGALVVTPRRRRLRSVTIEAPASAGSLATRRLGDGADLLNIRDYTTQDDARRIDWRASARLGRPMMKEFERDQESAIEILLDERTFGGDAREFEELIVKAASILDYCGEKGIHGSLAVPAPSGSSRSLAGHAAMIYLATVQPRRDAPRPGETAASPGVPRIVLSLDPEVRSRVHLEPYDSRSASVPGPHRRRAGDAP